MLWLGKLDLHTTWEPASSLPSTVIEEFEKGLISEGVLKKSSQYGHETSTIITEEKIKSKPEVKRTRIERPVIKESSGYVFDLDNSNAIQSTIRAYVDDKSTHTACNTEKDRHIRLNLRTAGKNIFGIKN